MATTERDYYELLGVRRTATEAEIKKAFRGLARELHPDVSEDPDAEARFKEVVEAYEVLSNSERRELYDRFGHAGLRSRGFTPTSFDLGTLGDLFSAFFGDDLFGVGGRPRGAARGADIAAEVTIDLVDSARGVPRNPSLVTLTVDPRSGRRAPRRTRTPDTTSSPERRGTVCPEQNRRLCFGTARWSAADAEVRGSRRFCGATYGSAPQSRTTSPAVR